MTQPRMPSKLSDSSHKAINMYALAASAAGVGILSLAQPAQAEIVYTKTHQLILLNTTYNLDLNHDGVTDFAISNGGCITGTTNCETAVSALYAIPVAGNSVEGRSRFGANNAYALPLGARIGPTQPFLTTKALMVFDISSVCHPSSQGTFWCGARNKYLGLRFEIGGETHYGWARLSTGANGHRLEALLTGYAYETIPNKPIMAGVIATPDDVETSSSTPLSKPATLGVLALGAPGLPIWRRKESFLTCGRGQAIL